MKIVENSRDGRSTGVRAWQAWGKASRPERDGRGTSRGDEAMGETAAGGAIRGWRSGGLLERLADLQRDGDAPAAHRQLPPRPPSGTKLRPFAVGLLGSLVLGVAAFAVMAVRPEVEAGERSSAPLAG